MLRSLGRVAFALMLGLPGLVLALLARPLYLGQEGMGFGILLAFAIPITWLLKRFRSPRAWAPAQVSEFTRRYRELRAAGHDRARAIRMLRNEGAGFMPSVRAVSEVEGLSQAECETLLQQSGPRSDGDDTERNTPQGS